MGKAEHMDVLLVGCGKMGGALLAQWLRNDAASFTVVDPVAQSVPEPATLFGSVDDLGTRKFDVIVVAVKPQMIDDVMPAYKSHLAGSGLIASIAAGYAVDRLRALFDTDLIVRIMPNLPAQIGKGVSGLYATSALTAAQRAQIDSLMQLAGRLVWVDDEDALDRVTAIAGSGPGYVFEIARCFVESAISLGFSEAQARDLVLETMAGTIDMARSSKESLETLRNNVTSKNGVTQAGLEQFHHDDRLMKLFEDVTRVAYERAVELR